MANSEQSKWREFLKPLVTAAAVALTAMATYVDHPVSGCMFITVIFILFVLLVGKHFFSIRDWGNPANPIKPADDSIGTPADFRRMPIVCRQK